MKRGLAAVFTIGGVLALPGFACAQDGPVMKRIAETKTITIGHRDASVPLSYLGPDGKGRATRSTSASRLPMPPRRSSRLRI